MKRSRGPKAPPPSAPPRPPQPPPRYDVIVGGEGIASPQYGLLACPVGYAQHNIALDLNGCDTVSLFGVQGSGKSYTLGAVSEMASMAIDGVNLMPSPAAAVVFHYHKGESYEPELLAAREPNGRQDEVRALFHQYGARPKGFDDMLLLVPESQVERRRKEYPGIRVEPIKFSSRELRGAGWKILLGAVDNQSLYMRQVATIMRQFRDDLTLDILREAVNKCPTHKGRRSKKRDDDEGPELSEGAASLINERIAIAEPYVDDSKSIGDYLCPGRVIVVDLRDCWTEKSEALELFLILMSIFSDVKSKEFKRLFVLDEAHKYLGGDEGALIGEVAELVREMRHRATTVVIASQDPVSIPRIIVELTTVMVLHKMTAPRWIMHLKSAVTSLDELSARALASLRPGEAWLWAKHASDPAYSRSPQKVVIRPRVTSHGGETRVAVKRG